ncbi:unnamed protein product, partial [marine sediment metagenome]
LKIGYLMSGVLPDNIKTPVNGYQETNRMGIR